MSTPTLAGLMQWVKTEAGNALTLVLILFAVNYLFKQQIGKMIGLFLLSGLVFFVIGKPDSVMKAVQAIFNMVVK